MTPDAPAAPFAGFRTEALAFYVGLEADNSRTYWNDHKDEFEREVRGPMVALVAALADEFGEAKLFRPNRDIRFSADKSPLKTHAAAHFPARGFARGEGAGLYFEVAPQWVWIGGGLYMPGTTGLQTIRQHIVASHPRLHRIVTSKRFSSHVGPLDGERLTRAPRGYPADHPAVNYLLFKQFLAGREHPAAFSCASGFYPELLRTFRATAPLVQFLNEALAGRRAQEAPALNLATHSRRHTGSTA